MADLTFFPGDFIKWRKDDHYAAYTVESVGVKVQRNATDDGYEFVVVVRVVDGWGMTREIDAAEVYYAQE